MAKKPNLGQINSTVFTASQLNAAFTKIDNAFENTLSLDGSTPNAMGADLDMNGNDIINTGVYYGQSIDVEEAVIGGKLFTGSITWRSDWTTSTSYQNLDVVRYNGDLYICLDEHTSGVFVTDLSSSKWELFVENSVGPEGPQGDPGASAYEIAVANGFVGTEEEWLASLIASPPTENIIVAVGDETTPLTTGTGKVTFRMPYAFTVTGVRASLTTAQGSGSIFTVDINEGGASILSTKLTIDNTEKTSTTAATASVISDVNLADDAEITIDIDQIGDGTAVGLKVTLIGHQ